MTEDLNPLALIEHRVLERARHGANQVDTAPTHELRGLIDDEIAQWRLDYKNGHRPFDLSAPALVADRAWRNLTGYGPLEPLLDDDDVWEIMINAPDQVFVKRHTGPSGYHDESFHDDEHVMRTLTKILDDASSSHRKLDPSEGLQDAQLDNGARLHIVHRDVGGGNHLIVNIRKFTGVGFTSLAQLVDRGMMTHDVARFLVACMRSRVSVVFAGPPGAGKTTMLSCCTAELDPSLRVVTAEEVFELDVPQPNVASMQTRAARPDRPAVDLRRLVAGFLRMAPDIAIVGEVRDREAPHPHVCSRCQDLWQHVGTARTCTGCAVPMAVTDLGLLEADPDPSGEPILTSPSARPANRQGAGVLGRSRSAFSEVARITQRVSIPSGSLVAVWTDRRDQVTITPSWSPDRRRGSRRCVPGPRGDR